MNEVRKMRAFLAVPSDGMWVESARDLVARLREALPEASWTKPTSWHLTLKFFEGITEGEARAFGEGVAADALATVRGDLLASGAVVFPARGPARVLGVGFAPSEALEEIARLAVLAEEHARRLSLAEERRPFHAHVTLARIRRAWAPEAVERFKSEVEGWTFPPWHARSCVLYESRLERDGAVHAPFEEWSFSGGPRGVRA